MENVIYRINLKIRYCYRKNFLLRFFVVILILLVFLLSFYYLVDLVNLMNDENPTTATFLSTLLGAIVGGLLTFYGSYYVNTKQLKYQELQRVCNTVYIPLYDELYSNYVQIRKYGFWYFHIRIDSYKTVNSVNYDEWSKIKSDNRILLLQSEFIKIFDNHINKLNTIFVLQDKLVDEMILLFKGKLERYTDLNENFLNKSNMENLSRKLLCNNEEEFIDTCVSFQRSIDKDIITRIASDSYDLLNNSINYSQIIIECDQLIQFENELLKVLEKNIVLSKI